MFGYILGNQTSRIFGGHFLIYFTERDGLVGHSWVLRARDHQLHGVLCGVTVMIGYVGTLLWPLLMAKEERNHTTKINFDGQISFFLVILIVSQSIFRLNFRIQR